MALNRVRTGAVAWSVVVTALVGGADLASKDFFDNTKVWPVHFTFTAEQYGGLKPVRKVGSVAGERLSGFQAPDGLRNGITGSQGLHFEYVHASVSVGDVALKDVAVRYKGNGTYRRGVQYGKVSFKTDLNKYVAGQKLADNTKLNFNNSVSDVSWMNEALGYRLYRDAGVPAARTSYARVFVTVPGQFNRAYQGLYVIVEDLDDRFAEQHFGNKDGVFFKPVIPTPFQYLGEDWKKYNQIYDPKRTPTEQEKRRVIDLSRLVTNGDDAAFTARVGEFVDLDEFARYMAVTVWLTSYDGILDSGQNYYLYLDAKTQKFQFLPWDLDRAFGQFGIFRGNAQTVNILEPWLGENRFLQRIFRVAAFRKLYLEHLDAFSKTIFKPERFGPQVDAIAAAVRPAIVEESAVLLGRFDAAVAGKTMPDTLDRNFGLPHIPIKTFVAGRWRSVVEQLERAYMIRSTR